MPSGPATARQWPRCRSSSAAVSCAVSRGAPGQFELAARLERDRAAAVRVVKADQMAAVLDALPADPRIHALEQGADPRFALIRDRRQTRAIKGNLLVFRADAKSAGRLASGLEPCRQRVTQFDNLPIDDVASHKGLYPCGRRAGDCG